MASGAQIKTRFLLLSDTHACWHPKRNIQLPKVDVLIHSGDLTMNGKIEQHGDAIALIRSIDADLKIVIPGNHDLTLDTEYYARNPLRYGPKPKYGEEQLREIRDLYTGCNARTANIHYLEEGIATFRLINGATLTVYASAYTPEFWQWSFAYPIERDRFNAPDALNPTPDFIPTKSHPPSEHKNIDVFITHGPPHIILDLTSPSHGPSTHVGCPHLRTAVSRSRPLLHCFGHIHEGWGALRKSWPSSPLQSSQSTQSTPQPGSQGAISYYHSLKARQIQDTAWDDPATLYSTTSSPPATDTHGISTDIAAHIDGTDLVRGAQTLFVNASVLDVHYQPVQRPWVVDLMLPRSSTTL